MAASWGDLGACFQQSARPAGQGLLVLSQSGALSYLQGMQDLYFKQLPLGPMSNFVYLVGSKSSRECVAIDPAWDIASIRDTAAKDDMRIVGAVVTHFHPDHCGGHIFGHDIQGVAELNGALSVPIYANEHEVQGLCAITGLSKTDVKPLKGGDKIEVGGTSITCLHTPGHTPGSQCLLCEGRLISGDTLFLTGCGRVDLPGGNSDQLYHTLTSTIAKLPGDTVICPGHHYDRASQASLAEVRNINPYLKVNSQEAWRRMFGQAP